jgi:hypothetical protein
MSTKNVEDFMIAGLEFVAVMATLFIALERTSSR